jgi:D-3-phosphoglycerate dehydrogenase
MSKIAVTSRSFSKNAYLKNETLKHYDSVKFNTKGLKLDGDSLVDFLAGSDKAIIALEKITGEVLDKLPKLKHISKYGVGIDNIDLNALKDRNITLSWKGGVNKRSVAELTMCFAISLLRNIQVSNQQIKSGTWKVQIGRGLSEITLGIVGLGHVGQELVRLLSPFGTRFLAFDIQDRSEFCSKYKNISQVPLEELQNKSDIITIHLPRTSVTRNFVNNDFISKMKKGSYLINTSRGEIVNEADLYEALLSGQLLGSAMDVFEKEPNVESSLFKLDNFISTPHIGGSSKEAIQNMGLAAINGLSEGKEALWENFFNYPQ